MLSTNEGFDIIGDTVSNTVGQFANGQIPFNRPVLGADLLHLQRKLGLPVYGMIWLLGLNTQSWYRHVTDPGVKKRKKLEREIGRRIETTRNLGLESKVPKNAGSDMLEKDQWKQKSGIASIRVELETAAKDDSGGTGSMFYGMPDESLALLVRFVDSNEGYVGRATLKPRPFSELQDLFSWVSPRELSQLVGRDATASHRWVKDGAAPHPTVARLIDCLVYWCDSRSEGEAILSKLDLWRNLVVREYELRAAWSNRHDPNDVDSKS